MSHHQLLLGKIANRTATIGVIGVGYVGLELVVGFARAGFNVIAVDVDVRKVDALNQGKSYIGDVSSEVVHELVYDGRLTATTDPMTLQNADVITICVPTPLRKTKDPDMSYIIHAIEDISLVVHPGLLVILESTTYPGTTQELIAPRLAQNGLVLGHDVFVAFSPERIDPGNHRYGLRNTPKVVGGMTPACTDIAQALYATAVDHVVPVSSPTSAEMVKLLENTFRAVNIGLVNEMALMCDKLGIDVWEVIEAAATKPFGFMPFYPGPGLGGHCIPVDPHYLSWKLKTLNYNARFIELASEINTSMPLYVVEKITSALNDAALAVRGSRILILGVAYKPDVDDVRESPAIDVIELLRQRGGHVMYHDPLVPYLRLDGDHTLESEAYSPDLLAGADCVVIITHHSTYDWHHVLAHSRRVVDTRHVTAGISAPAQVVTL